MEIISDNALNYNDINSKFVKNIIHKLNSNLLQKGFTIILINQIVENNFSNFKNIKIISILKEENQYVEVIKKNNDENVIYLLNKSFSMGNNLNLALKYVNTSHFVFLDKIDDLEITQEVPLDINKTYILKRTSNLPQSSIMNHIFTDYYKENYSITETNQLVENKIETVDTKQETIDFHPLLINLDVPVIKEIEENDDEEEVVYPIENHLIKLNSYKGILFPTRAFSKIFFKGVESQDTLLIAITEFIINNEINICFSEQLLFKGIDQLSIQTNHLNNTLTILNSLLEKRVSDKASQYVQYVVDCLLLNVSNTFKDDDEGINNIIKSLHDLNLDNISFEILSKGIADELVIAYCFPPYNDTSGNVMAKRIFAEKNKVDIISNNMDRIRKKDYSLNGIANKFIDTKFLMTAPQAFSSYQSISEFIEQGMDVYHMYKEKYKKMYSRAMFPASHFLAYEIKMANPNIYWRAEFSDPLLTDVSSNERYSPIKDDDYIDRLKAEITPEYQNLVDDNVFNLCEILPLSIADELIFTNEHQLEYIIKRFNDEIKASIRKRAVISKHPTLPEEYYSKEISYYNIEERKINLAYFGNFYDTRGFREIELFCKYLRVNNITNFLIHVFTNINGKVINMLENSEFKEHIILNPYLDYFEFLNLTNKMDVLMIYDAHTLGIKDINPYLPSKLSDYIGSKALTLAFIEENSILSKQNHKNLYKVNMNEFSNYPIVMKKIADRINKSLT
ncbi:hypothetical protein [Macrococcus animalis]|uniref:hypothetical protein n=1 Tax=Macrococcus animalis TaxID=3395467 RepID=UPI0039BDFA9A